MLILFSYVNEQWIKLTGFPHTVPYKPEQDDSGPMGIWNVSTTVKWRVNLSVIIYNGSEEIYYSSTRTVQR
jgi:hypothetical protein